MICALPSPWTREFLQLVGTARENLLVVSPYVTNSAMNQMRTTLAQKIQIHLITDLGVRNLVEGSVEPECLCDLMMDYPQARITFLPRVHAKVYVADQSQAIVTSSNLTTNGLARNYEYGLLIDDVRLVQSIREDIEAYARLGTNVPLVHLQALTRAAQKVQRAHKRVLASAGAEMRRMFAAETEAATQEVLRARAYGKTTNAIFSETILYLLRTRGALSTRELNPLVQNIHPDLCDDTIDRVISGVHFGKRWKHYVRNAQQGLKDRGEILLSQGGWQIR